MYKLNKYIFTFLPLIISIFFLFCSNVKADTTSWEIPNSVFDVYYNNFSTLNSIATDTIANDPDFTWFNRYTIIYSPNETYPYSIVYVGGGYTFEYSNNSYTSGRISAGGKYCYYDNSFSLVSCSTISSSYRISNIFTSQFVLYKDNQVYDDISPCVTVSSIYNGNNTYNFGTSSTSCVMPTIDYLSTIWTITPPEPPDSYPLLTSFYSIFIEKLSLLCEYVYTNYIFLSIFVVLIIYFSILLLRRLK